MTLSINIILQLNYTLPLCWESFADCRILFIVSLNAVLLNVVRLNVICWSVVAPWHLAQWFQILCLNDIQYIFTFLKNMPSVANIYAVFVKCLGIPRAVESYKDSLSKKASGKRCFISPTPGSTSQTFLDKSYKTFFFGTYTMDKNLECFPS